MAFGKEKYVMLIMKSGKRQKTEESELSSQDKNQMKGKIKKRVTEVKEKTTGK